MRVLFDRLVDVPVEQRDAVLVEECGGDADLLRELVELLAAARGEEVAPPAGEAPAQLGSQLRIGSFFVGDALPAGHRGRVHRAWRVHDGRAAALRWVALDPADRAVVRRLLEEARAIEAFTHAHCVSVLETGVCALPGARAPAVYFAAEWVAGGLSLPECGRTNALAVEERLALFRDACLAVADLHARGLVHGNLSAANVLVDAERRVRIADLGVEAVLRDPDDAGSDSPSSRDLADLGRLLEALLADLAAAHPVVQRTRALARSARASDPRSRPASVADLARALAP